MDAVALALVSASFFGAMPVAVRFALGPPMVPAAVGALLMQIATFAVLCVAAAVQGGVTLDGIALEDLDRTARLLAAFTRRLGPDTDFIPR